MKKFIKKLIMFTAPLLVMFLLNSCYTPSPLYGTWTDNGGNKITFISDGSFIAKLADAENNTTTFLGTYTVFDNVLMFSITKTIVGTNESSISKNMNTEWDIRGSMLYLTWTFNETYTKKITLYHTSK